ncbi:MAG TPA: leucyl aminopeptidase family protein [Steroidobacteraceae bacterium]|nr:leucyl aminopeptidase family protein [Steroidobacteraceae bacterium]
MPLDQLLVTTRSTGARITAARLARYSSAVLFLPLAPTAADFRALPHGAVLRDLFTRKVQKAGDCFHLRVGARAQTLLVVASVAEDAGTFERLQAAGKLARSALDGDPASLIVWQQGCAESAAQAMLHAMIAALQAAAFRLASFKSKPKARARLTRIDVAPGGRLPDLDTTLATAAGNNLARWLTALPPNVLDARGYRNLLAEIARQLGAGYTFYGEADLKRLGAGAFLAVSQGNATRDAGIVRLTYRPRGGSAPDLSLVGKGICFDTGGTNLKTHKSMLDMHTDMEGSAVAVGSLYALHMLRSRTAIDCWLAITENSIGPKAYKPQDLVKALNGTTIQVIHTDAEGRMVLADTLALASTRKPRAIIDYATLTGACIYALTERYSGAFTNRLELRDMIESAGTSSGERVWCFPMDGDYDTDIESSVADVMQCATEGKGDHIIAARFLSRFVPKDVAWLHLDLSAGTRHGGLAHIGTEITGFGVRYTLDLLRRGWPRMAASSRGTAASRTAASRTAASRTAASRTAASGTAASRTAAARSAASRTASSRSAAGSRTAPGSRGASARRTGR